MLGALVIGAEAAHQQRVEEVTNVHALGPMVVTAEDQQRALERAGLTPIAVQGVEAPPVVPTAGADRARTVREIQQVLRDNPAAVAEIVAEEAARASQGLEVRVSVLRACRPVAEAQALAELVAAIDTAVNQLLSPGAEG